VPSTAPTHCCEGLTGCPRLAANACDADGNSELVANAVYDTCTDDEATGATCIPTCDNSYTATTADTDGFVLNCDSNGDFSSTGSALVCGAPCGVGSTYMLTPTGP
jgi:hypothetical protein